MACNSFGKYVLKTDWQWVNIIKAPKVHTLPDILTLNEVVVLNSGNTSASLPAVFINHVLNGLRLSETLALQVSDIDAQRKQVHIRRGKRHKDRFVSSARSDLSRVKGLMAKTSQSL